MVPRAAVTIGFSLRATARGTLNSGCFTSAVQRGSSTSVGEVDVVFRRRGGPLTQANQRTWMRERARRRDVSGGREGSRHGRSVRLKSTARPHTRASSFNEHFICTPLELQRLPSDDNGIVLFGWTLQFDLHTFLPIYPSNARSLRPSTTPCQREYVSPSLIALTHRRVAYTAQSAVPLDATRSEPAQGMHSPPLLTA